MRIKRQHYLTIVALVTVLLFGTNFANALEPIPQESGFSGYIRPGVGYISLKSNMVARFLGVDLSEKRAGSLFESPTSKSSPFVLVPLLLEYTVADTHTQLLIGTEPTDLIRFEYSQQIGIKQEIGMFGILQGGFLYSPIALKVWQDPYVAGYQDRVATNQNSNGGRLVWDRPFGTRLQLQYTYRKIDLGKEASGEFLGLNSEKRGLLDRNGNRHVGEILYRFDVAQKHWVTPAFKYTRNDLEGGAMAGNAVTLQFTYTYMGDPFAVNTNVFWGVEDHDERNPIYNKFQTDDHIGLQAAIYYKNPWGWRVFGSNPMKFYVSGAFVDIDANIDFYDQQAIMATGGVLFRW